MTCPACGDTHKKTTHEFSRAIIEIDNPEAINIFRKVIIPSSMGDDTDIPAAIGKYRNVLLNYEANNHTYLYSSDGVPTLLTSDVAETIEQRVADLEVTLADEIKIREDTDNDLQSQINTKADTDSLATVATTGDYADLANKPTIGNATLTIQKNSTNIGTFTANSTTDATIDITVPTTPADIGAQAEITSDNKLSADLVDDTDATNKFVTAADLSAISTALQPADIDKVVMTDIDVSGNTSTTTVSLEGAKENLMSGAQTTKSIALPVASTTEAGVMNSATFDAVTNNTNNINALLNGAVAVTGLSASPSQSDITTAWQTETGLSTLINRASVYDVSNDKVWTYYTNDTTWHAASNTAQVTINTFTNSSEGTIKGSTNVGQVFAENDGTGSVNGWDALNAQVSDNTNNIGSLQTSVAGKQDKLTAGSNITISSNTISATDTTYTAGTGLSLVGTEFSADTSVLQEKLTAGNAIDITSNVISADIYPADYFTADGTVTNTGSSIILNNTLPAKLKSVDLYGDTAQQTYTGKNLLGLPNGTETSKGVEWVRLNNSATGTGTASGNYSRLSESYTNFASPLPAGTYTFSIGSAISKRLELLLVDSSNTNHFNYINIGDTSVTITTNYQAVKFRVAIANLTVDESINVTISNLQLESGNQATPFEPYVGGTASPNPDYPQDINVVTGTQTVEVHGKNYIDNNNLNYDFTNVSPTTQIELTSTSTGIQMNYTGSGSAPAVAFKLLDLTGYEGKTIRISSTFTGQRIAIQNVNADVSDRDYLVYTTTSGETISWTVPNDLSTLGDKHYLAYYLRGSQGITSFNNLILTIDDSDMTFTPYQGQSYTVDLGSTELCKIGDYQDYIYKSGDDWYVHKETVKEVFDGSENWNYGSISTFYRGSLTFSDWKPAQQNLYNSHFIAGNTGNTPNVCGIGSTQVFMSMDASLGVTTKAEWLTWLSNNNVTMYTILATPTDTKITDADLIADLDALAGAKSYLGVTNFNVSATGTNLPALLVPTAYRYSAEGVAEVLGAMPGQQAQSNWTQADANAVDYIKNKPANLVQDASYVHTDNNFTTTLKDKLDGIASGAEVNVQSNWTQTNTSADDYIKNKPALATVATSGSYSDLTNKPALATVATSGNYNDLTNKPSIPAAQIQSDWTQSNALAKDYIKNKPTIPNITMTNVDPGEGSALAENNYIGVYDEDPIILDYSLTEISTGTKWIDGKTIYKKTINFGALPNGTTKTVAHGISNLYRVLKVEGYAISSGGTTLFLPVVATNAQYNVTVSTTAANIVMETQVDRSGYAESYLTLYYTKSS